MDKKIFVWVKEPQKPARHVWISNTLKNLQNTVGGYIECYPLSVSEVIICNEEGRILNLPYNGFYEGSDFCGTIIFAGVAGEEFTDSSLTLEQIKKITN